MNNTGTWQIQIVWPTEIFRFLVEYGNETGTCRRRSRGRVVKAMDLKSIGFYPRRFESCRLRPNFFFSIFNIIFIRLIINYIKSQLNLKLKSP